MAEKCDFCGQPTSAIKTVFYCQDFRVTSPEGEFIAWSKGGWVACHTCRLYVEVGAIRRLADQIMRHEITNGDFDRREAEERRDFRMHIWSQFQANRVTGSTANSDE